MQKQADDQARPIRSVFDADCAEAAECAKAMQWNAQIGTRTCPYNPKICEEQKQMQVQRAIRHEQRVQESLQTESLWLDSGAMFFLVLLFLGLSRGLFCAFQGLTRPSP